MILSAFGRDSGQSLDAVRMASKSETRPPTSIIPGDESRRRRTSQIEAPFHAASRTSLRPFSFREEHEHAPLLLHGSQSLAVPAHDEADAVAGDRVPGKISSGSFHIYGDGTNSLLFNKINIVDRVVALLLRAVQRDRESVFIKFNIGSRHSRNFSFRGAAPTKHEGRVVGRDVDDLRDPLLIFSLRASRARAGAGLTFVVVAHLAALAAAVC